MKFQKKRKTIQTLNLKIDNIGIEQVTDFYFWGFNYRYKFELE